MENTLDLIDSEFRRLNFVASEILDNAGVDAFHLLRGKYREELASVEAQRKVLRGIQAKAKLAQMEFEAYEKAKKI